MDKEDLTFPLTNPLSLVIGSILYITLLPFVFVRGYLIRVSRTTLKEKNVMPKWEKWRKLFVDGVKYCLVLLPWLMVTTIIYIVTLSQVDSNLAMLLGILNLVLILGFGFFLPFIIVRLAETNSLLKALDLKFIFKRIKKVWKEYLKLWLIICLVFSVAIFLAAFSGTLFVLFILLFYVELVFIKTFSKLYMKSL